MKNFSFLTVAIAAVSLAACSASKPAARPDYSQQWQQQQQSVQQRPSRTLRPQLQSEELATEDCDTWRALGTATSYVEKVARNEAVRDARNQLAQMMKVAVEGAAQDYEQGVQKNMKSSAETLGEAVMTQFVAEEVANTRAIHYDVFDLADGSVQVYVCIEIRETKKEFAAKLDNTLEREDLIGIQYDRERFIDKMAAGLEEYKKRNRETAE